MGWTSARPRWRRRGRRRRPVLARLGCDTPAQDPDKVEDIIADCIRELAEEHDVEAAGLGAAGFVHAARSTVLFAPNLAWRNEPLRAAVEQRTGLPVVVENDANAAAWGETRFGAGHGQPFTVTVNIGTGLGGGVVLGGSCSAAPRPSGRPPRRAT
jgi:glucokinase